MKSEELSQKLEEHGVEVEKLYVIYAGSEQLIGELQDGLFKNNEKLYLKNPKRVLRLQQVLPEGVAISFMIGDFDFISSGAVTVMAPTLSYKVLMQPEETKQFILSTYLNYFERKTVHKAQEAGLIVPKAGISSPFKKGP